MVHTYLLMIMISINCCLKWLEIEIAIFMHHSSEMSLKNVLFQLFFSLRSTFLYDNRIENIL